MHEKYMALAIKEAKKALKKGDVPIGAIIVYNDKVIARGYNQKEYKNIATKHAEIIAIEKACKKLKTWHLDNCTLYTTIEPCSMCLGAIMQSRINNIVYGSINENFGAIHNSDIKKINIVGDILSEETAGLLKDFFKSLR